jgi:hypothetical protein
MNLLGMLTEGSVGEPHDVYALVSGPFAGSVSYALGSAEVPRSSVLDDAFPRLALFALSGEPA